MFRRLLILVGHIENLRLGSVAGRPLLAATPEPLAMWSKGTDVGKAKTLAVR
jgi:hypothetical protein